MFSAAKSTQQTVNAKSPLLAINDDASQRVKKAKRSRLPVLPEQVKAVINMGIDTAMAIGLWDLIDSNFDAFPNTYRERANKLDYAIQIYLMVCASLATTFQLSKQSRTQSAKTIAIIYYIMIAFNEAVSTANFTEDTLISLFLQADDTNGSDPSGNNSLLYFGFILPSIMIGLAHGAFELHEGMNEVKERFQAALNHAPEALRSKAKQTQNLLYRICRSGLRGSQLFGGTLNQAAVDIMWLWAGYNIIERPAWIRTSLYLGGHATGLTTEVLMLNYASKPVERFIEYFFNGIASAFYSEELITDYIQGFYEHLNNKDASTASILMPIFTLLVLSGLAALTYYGVKKQHQADNHVNAENPVAQPLHAGPSTMRKHDDSSSEDALPVDSSDIEENKNADTSVSTSSPKSEPVAISRTLSNAGLFAFTENQADDNLSTRTQSRHSI